MGSLRIPIAKNNFSSLRENDLIERAQKIHDGMVANAAVFDDPPITMVNLQADITSYKVTLAAARKGSKFSTSEKNNAKRFLINDLRSIIQYVNQLVFDQLSSPKNYSALEVLVLLSGAEVSKAPNPAAANIGLAVPIIKKAISDQTGTLHILLEQYERFKRGTKLWNVRVRTSEIPANPPAPAVPAGEWRIYTRTSSNMNLDDLTPGLMYDYQVAAVGGRDVKLNQENPINWTPIRSVVIV